MTEVPRHGCTASGWPVPLRRRVIAVIVLVLLFPFAALGWFEPAQIVALVATVATVIVAIVKPAPVTGPPAA